MPTIVRNRAAHFNNLVEGLRQSSMRPAALVVVDMSDIPLAPPPTDFPVTMVRLETDSLPLAAARNRAVTAATGDLLLFLDVDCIPLRDCLATMDAALGEHNALLCADVRYLRPDDARGDYTDARLLASGAPHAARAFSLDRRPARALRCAGWIRRALYRLWRRGYRF